MITQHFNPRDWAGAVPTLLLVACTILFMDCRGSAARRNATVVDEAGRQIAVPTRIERIVSLAPSLTELAVAAGAVDRLVGVSSADDLPQVDSLAHISALPVDFEGILNLNPDLVLLLEGVNRSEDADRLRDLGIAAYVFDATAIDDVLADIQRLGEMVGTEETANDRARTLRDAVDFVTSTAAAAPERPSVLVLVGDADLYAFGSGSYIQDLVRRAGGSSITADIPQMNAVLSEEYVLSQDPDVIVGAFGEDYDVAELTRNHPAFTRLRAVRSGRIYSVDPDVLLRPGPRLVDALAVIAVRLHPEAFNQRGDGVVVLE